MKFITNIHQDISSPQYPTKQYKEETKAYRGCFIFRPGLCCTWNIMIWFVESLLTPVAWSPSIWEPTTPINKGSRILSKTVILKHNEVRHDHELDYYLMLSSQNAYCMYARTTNSARRTFRFSSNSMFLSLISKERLK